MISRGKYSAHTEPLFKSSNILKAEYIFKIKALKFYYKYLPKQSHFILKKCSPKFWLAQSWN